MILSDEAELQVAVYGLRTFRISVDGHLLPVTRIDGSWLSGTCQAQCRRHRNHQPPTAGCSCGVYCFKDLTTLRRQYGRAGLVVVAVVALSGDTLEGDRGWRTAAATVVEMFVAAGTVPAQTMSRLRENLPGVRFVENLPAMIGRYPGLSIGPEPTPSPSVVAAAAAAERVLTRRPGLTGGVHRAGRAVLRVGRWALPGVAAAAVMMYPTNWETAGSVPVPHLDGAWSTAGYLYAATRVLRGIGIGVATDATFLLLVAAVTALAVYSLIQKGTGRGFVGLQRIWSYLQRLLLGGMIAAVNYFPPAPRPGWGGFWATYHPQILGGLAGAGICLVVSVALTRIVRSPQLLTASTRLLMAELTGSRGVRFAPLGWLAGPHVAPFHLSDPPQPKE